MSEGPTSAPGRLAAGPDGAAGPQPADRPRLFIVGIRGVPAAHGGFETFAERLALWMRDRGWHVTVYCQGSPTRERMEDDWAGIHRIHLPIRRSGAIGTMEFDGKSVRDLLTKPGLVLTLGYNTGYLSALLRLRGRSNVINMDGLEFKRSKYSWGAKAYLWFNERLAAWSGDTLIADHPAIANHLATRVKRSKINVITYGSDGVEQADHSLLAGYGLEPNGFFTVIARPEPENSILEIVRAFSAKRRGVRLAVLGTYADGVPYQKACRAAAGPEVSFIGPIYDQRRLATLRHLSIAYVHGHQVGGTNPSLVEALGAGNAVIAHDNHFNRWVAAGAALFFGHEREIGPAFEQLAADSALRDRLREAARARWREAFTWPQILARYEEILSREYARL